jgi:hypothetical protein
MAPHKQSLERVLEVALASKANAKELLALIEAAAGGSVDLSSVEASISAIEDKVNEIVIVLNALSEFPEGSDLPHIEIDPL